MTRTRIALISSALFLLFLLLGWVAGVVIAPEGAAIWVLRGSVWFLGAIASVLLYLYLRSRYPSVVGGSGRGSNPDIDVPLAAVEARLKASSIRGPKRLGKLPLLIVLGPHGSAKTSTVVHSGTEPELLAGEVERDGVPIPTEALNVWYTREMLVAEAGGPLLDDPGRWGRFLRRIRPGRFSAAFSRKAQAPRMAVVCFSCDEFLKPGASEAVPSLARRIRERLADASHQLGIRLPVYVVFTKTDRIPYFHDFVRNLSREEAQEVLGATLPAVHDTDAGAYGEREATRVRQAFDSIHHTLALRRLDLLPRETSEEGRSGAYEFPRELRKVTDLATAFLVELCRPRQLGAGPFLRGFYFSGVRPIILSDVVREPEAPRAAAGPQVSLGATVVFNPDSIQSAAHTPTPPAAPGGRKVPEWTFLKRIFSEIVFRDGNAMALTAGGRRVNLVRRSALGLATAGALVLIIGFTVSFFGNRILIDEAFAAARATEGITPQGGELASVDALARLDELRAGTESLRRFDRDGRPMRLRWGLYSGDDLLVELRRIYFDRFDRVLWADTRDRLMSALRGLPETPGASAEYGAVYDMLKAHLVTTSHPRESTSDFLAPVLLDHWAAGLDVGEERQQLAHRQFAFFGSELPLGNPYPNEPEDATVARTRLLLQQFSNVDQFYQVMVSEASADHTPIRFAEVFPAATGVVSNDFVVPGAFTEAGWQTVQANLANLDRLFAREDWVVGERAVSAEERVRLAQELRSRYVADYIAHWREFLRAGSIIRASGIDGIARTLEQLTRNESPLLQMLALAARNTDVDSTSVAVAFQPLHSVTPPAITDRYISDANASYIAALANLQSSLEQVAAASGPAREGAMTTAISGADRVRAEVRSLAQGFSIEGEASIVGTAVQTLLEAPVAGTESLVGALPSAEINQAGAAFCQPFRQIVSRYPFDSGATAEATVEDVNALFQRGSSALWTFYEDVLQGLLTRQGTRFAARVGASPQPSPSFVAFFNRAAEFSETIYDERGAGPRISFLLRAQTTDELPEITINIDGQAQTFTRTFAAARPYTWEAARAQLIRISGSLNGRDETLLEGSGPWGIFRLFQVAEWEPLGADRYMLRWPVTGTNLTLSAELTLNPGSPAIFRRDFFSGFECVSRISQ